MRIVVATDGSDSAEEALRFLRAFPLPDGTVLGVVSVIEEASAPLFAPGAPAVAWEGYDRLRDAERQAADRALLRAERLFERPGIDVSTVVRSGHPAHEILCLARDFEADLIVVGSRGKTGLDSFLLGSVARSVASHATCPVLIARPLRHGLRAAVLAVDDSPHAVAAASIAARLPFPADTQVVVTSVTQPYDPYPGLVPSDPDLYQSTVEEIRRRRIEVAQRIVDSAGEVVREAGKEAETVLREGKPVDEILSLAQERDADLVIAGARGSSPFVGFFIGSVCDTLMKRSPVALLVCR